MSSNIDKCVKDYCVPFVKKKHDNYNSLFSSIEGFNNNKKGSNNHLTRKESMNIDLKSCKRTACNPGCKGTFFENGNSNKLPNSFKNNSNTKSKNNMLKLYKKTRKNLFKNKKSILKQNSFYYKLNNSTIKRKKNKGVLSSCSVIDMD
jgi:hypothetical protein